MSFKLENTKRYLKEYTQSLLDISVKELNRKDRVRNYSSQSVTSSITASGKLKDSLNITEKDTDTVLQLNLKGNAYGEQIDEGTKSTSVSKGKLIQWIKNKNGFKDLNGKIVDLNDTEKIDRIAGLISKSLKLKGIKPTNFLTDIINSKIKELKNIEAPIELDIESDIDNVLLKLGYKKTNNTFTIETKTISNVNNN
tara:strand:+ start:1458 stop:2048 length:591 start_codon:yes stop_codon:yes gene_type:complete